MYLKGDKSFLQILNYKRKRRLIALLVLSSSIIFGYIAFLACSFSGFLIAKYLGAKKTADRSRIPSIMLPVGKYRVHLHHWLISSAVMALALLTGSWFFPSYLFFGFLTGIAFQGIYCYEDWHKIFTLRQDWEPGGPEQ